MKTIELNNWASLIVAMFAMGIGSLLPSLFGVTSFIAGAVYTIMAIVLFSTYKRKGKIFYRFNNIGSVSNAEFREVLNEIQKRVGKTVADKLHELNE